MSSALRFIAITIKYYKIYASQIKFVITPAYILSYIKTHHYWLRHDEMISSQNAYSVLWSLASPTRVPECLQSVVSVGAEAAEVAKQSVLEGFIALCRCRAPLPAAADHVVPRPQESHRRLLQTNTIPVHQSSRITHVHPLTMKLFYLSEFR